MNNDLESIFNLLCLLKDNTTKRISLSSITQDEMKNYLNKNIEKILSSDQIKFTGEYKPEENQVLYIDNFSNQLCDINHQDILSFEILDINQISNIKVLIFNFNEYVSYQSFDSRKIIRPEKWSFKYSNNTFSKIEDKGIIIDSNVDVLYLRSDKKLLFQSFHNASKIFDLSQYYREATDSELESFYNSDIFLTNESVSNEIFNSRMRKKIHLILKNNVIEKVRTKFKDVSKYAKELNINLRLDSANNKIIFPNDKKEVEKLINFLNEDLFKSPISDVIYETNSKKPFS